MKRKHAPDHVTEHERHIRIPIVPRTVTDPGQQESLVSVISRTATAMSFSIQDFLLHAFFPRLGKAESQPLLNWYDAGAMMGPSKTSDRWINAMDQVTGVHDHAEFTLKPFDHLWGIYGLKPRRTRAWCPDCYVDDLELGRSPYDRLSWSVLAVKGCAVHRQLLTTRCPSCAESDERYRAYGYQPGICGFCGSWLRRKRHPQALHPDSLEWWTTMSVEAILAEASTAWQWDRTRVAERLQDVCNVVFDGNVTQGARRLQMSKGMFSDILSGRRIVPSVDMLLRISYVCQIEITSFWQPMSLDTQLLGPETKQLPATFVRQTHGRSDRESRRRMTVVITKLLAGKLEEFNSWTAVARRIRVPTDRLRTFAGEHRSTIAKLLAARKRKTWDLMASAAKIAAWNYLMGAAADFDSARRPISRRALLRHLMDQGVFLDERRYGPVYSELITNRKIESARSRRGKIPEK